MLLTYNIGNDEILFGFMDGDELISTATLSSDTRRSADEYAVILRGIFDLNAFKPDAIDGAICSSVVPTLTETVRDAVEKLLGIRSHVLGVGTKTGLRILTDDPTQLGADLVASAVGALAKYKPPMILVNFGAATTFSVLNTDGAFVGCAIAPGVSLSAKALSKGTSLLPHFAPSIPKKCIGTNTQESLQSGCIFGSVAMTVGMIERIERELEEKTSVIASGKDCESIIALCERDIVRDDTVLLTGLAEIYKRNLRKRK